MSDGMTRATKHKLCWNCEGRVQFDQENCPFCGVYLSPSIAKEAPPEFPEPLYQKANPLEEDAYSHQEHSFKENDSTEHFSKERRESRDVILPLALLLSGSIFCLFGIVLFLFSKDGTLTLKWDANFFPFYLIGGAILFFSGWRTLNRLKDDPQ